MVGCAACGDWCAGRICDICRASLRPGPLFTTPGGLVVSAALRHQGAARRLVHGLKYRGLHGPVAELAEAMTLRMPTGVTALVPVRRAVMRRWRHGLDPAFELARRLSLATATPLVDALSPALWWPRHAGRGEAPRSVVRFRRRRGEPDSGWLLIDDVATSGATLDAAAEALGLAGLRGLVATAPSRVGVTLVNTTHRSGWQEREPNLPSPGAAGREATGERAKFDAPHRRVRRYTAPNAGR